MRIRVTDILELLASGLTNNEITKEELPDLENEDVISCLNYALLKVV